MSLKLELGAKIGKGFGATVSVYFDGEASGELIYARVGARCCWAIHKTRQGFVWTQYVSAVAMARRQYPQG
ncbi:MAG: hypothetical protein V1846_01990 [Candidatus Komeilibacteria bacterium]